MGVKSLRLEMFHETGLVKLTWVYMSVKCLFVTFDESFVHLQMHL